MDRNQKTPTESSLETSGKPHIQRFNSYTNNSDEETEDDSNLNSLKIKSKQKDDYVSFPTIPDPESNTKSISGLLSQTLRKVTNNASHLVQNYSLNTTKPTEQPTKPTQSTHQTTSLNYENSLVAPSIQLSKSEDKSLNDNKTPLPTEDRIPNDRSQIISSSTSSPVDSTHHLTESNESIANAQPVIDKTKSQPLYAASKSLNNQLLNNLRQKTPEESNGPRVTSDNKTLRISTMQFPRVHSINGSITSSIVNVNASALSEINAITSSTKIVDASPRDVGSKEKILKNKISSIFNNLPNDIEFSDDSASDSDTIQNDDSSQSISSSLQNEPNSKMNNSKFSINTPHNQQIQFDLNAMYSESVAKSSPVKAESQGGATFITNFGQSPTISSFQAIQDKDQSIIRKKHSNLSSALLDNARNIINNNIGVVTSSASSIVGSKIRKKKLKKKSENPLKNGGIPRRYWMDDAFVSDCLNCFKPFTAFRRKHHCRFCGQIFCSDCTMFISYNQHKDKRNNNHKQKPYNDKLRVCKPCYSDVIIYLSDDSSSTDSEEETSDVITEVSKKNEELLVPNHPLSRIRSLSTGSYRESAKMMPSDDPQMSKTENSSSVSDSNSTFRTQEQLIYPDESIKIHPKQAPKMAIPTTRAGESVEIPLIRNSYSNSNILKTPTTVFNQNFKVSLMTPNHHPHHPHHPHHHHQRLQHNTESHSNKSWLKNHLSPSLQHSDLITSGSFDSIGNPYNNFMSRKPSFKQRLTSSGNPYKKEYSQEPDDIQSFSGFETDKRLNSSFSQNELEMDDPNEAESEDDEEDEHAMSLYASLTDNGFASTPITSKQPPSHGNFNTSVPTLGEFPSMKTGISDFNTFSRLTHSNSATHYGDYTSNSKQQQPDNIRSRARAHASLQRMRSRRQSKSTRTVSILTQNNNRLPSMDSPTHKNNYTSALTPIVSSDFPGNTTKPSAPHSRLTMALSDESIKFKNDFDTELINSNTDMSPIEPKISSSTVMENIGKIKSGDYFDTHHEHFGMNDLSAWRQETNNTSGYYADALEVILRQCLKDCDIEENIDDWVQVLRKSLAYVDKIKLTDTLDIRQYVKIKKIYGGHIFQTKVINGLFITKNIDSKRMASKISNPKIALLMFPIEYLKQREQFISLRIIHSQQSVYITNLVSKIVSLKPDIVIVGDTVCGLAEQQLEEAGISVMSNVKPQIIERISRYTKADIFQTVNDLFFKKCNLGSCEEFSIKNFKYKDTIKTFAFFVGSDIQQGFTISLRGGDENLLNSVKYAAETLMPGYLNAKFERSFFDNLLLTYKEEKMENSKLNKMIENINEVTSSDEFGRDSDCELHLDKVEVVEYVKLFHERKLSTSPSVQYTLPTPLVRLIESFVSYYKFNNLVKTIQKISSASEIKQDWLELFKIDYKADDLPLKQQDLIRILKFASNSHLKIVISEYLSRCRTWTNCMRYTSYQLYPIFHRNIHVLHSTVSIKHATPCSGPSIVVIDYYTDNDKCLGLFLDQAFYESSKICDECGESFLDHYKSYVHGNAKIDLIIEKYDIHRNVSTNSTDFQGKNQRVMWSYCKECNYITPIIALSDETYYLSIGKFFELIFYGENVIGGCKHDFFKSYVKCFGFNDLVIRLEYSSIDNYEIVVPKKQIDFVSEIDIKLKLDSYQHIKSKAQSFFESISKRLNRVKLDTFDKAEDGSIRITEMKDKLEKDSKAVMTKMQSIYESISPSNYLALNVVLRDLQKLGVYWDLEFNEFEKTYLPSENDVNRITQFHLRKFLIEKYYDDNKQTELNDLAGKQEPQIAEESEQSSIKNDNDNDEADEESSKYLSPFPEFVPRKPRGHPSGINFERKLSDSSIENKMFSTNRLYEQNSNISERISKWEKTASESQIPTEKSLSHRNSDSSFDVAPTVIPSQNKVIHLANFFDKMYYDQISLEFSKQREKELKKKSKVKAQPILDSRPIVEIYNKIEDVVGLDDKERDKDKEKEKENDSTGKFNKDDPRNKEEFKSSDTPEKTSLLKSLTNFWADRSATLWDPLLYPLDATEHTFADSDVIVREDEPSSLVAFCLSSNDYKQKISQALKEEETSENDLRNSQPSLQDSEQHTDDVESDLKRNDLFRTSNIDKKNQQFSKIEKKFKKSLHDTIKVNKLEDVLNKSRSNHLKYQFIDGNTHLSCKIFYSEQFEAFRKSCGNNDNFIQSLSRCIKWQSSGGKSGSSFLKTLDNRYIVKELSKSELESFVSIAPFYFKYISQSMFNTLTTAIAKIFGFYQVQIKNNQTGKIFKMDFLIMENLFYNHKTTRIFDLKGSMRNRHVQQTGKENEVLLDENMIEYIYESPVFVKEQSKKLLRGCLFNDTSFLSAMDVMDYSLVIGIDDNNKKLYTGIIDWLRTFTWDKKVENWVKGNNLIGGGRKGKDPTIVTPKQYRVRFREAMERYILEVPDIWYEGNK